MAQKHGIIRIIYLYLFALVGLFIFVFSAVNVVGAVLDRYVWPQEYVDYNVRKPIAEEPADDSQGLTEEEQREQFVKQQNNDFKRRVNQAVPGVVIGYLLWWFHWSWIKRDKE